MKRTLGSPLTRRRFLGAGASALVSAACAPLDRVLPARVPWGGAPVLNDIHSRLNPTRVARVVAPTSLAELRAALARARTEGPAVSVAGGRHAMGGQQFGAGTLHLDTRRLRRVLDFDRRSGIIEVEAGIQWPDLIGWYLAAQAADGPGFGIVQKQTGADRLTLGGALAANAHGRGLRLAPIIGDVESFTLVDAGGEVHTCSRSENGELFGLAIGGYGLFGVVHAIRLRLTPRRKLERVVEIRDTDGLADAFARRIAEGCLYGDYQFETDERSPGFLRRGVLACYRPVAPATPIPADQRELSDEQWVRLLEIAHTSKEEAFTRYARHYAATNGQIYWSDTAQLAFYPDHYHRALDRRLGVETPGSEMITEVYVPRFALSPFLAEAAEALRAAEANVIYGTVRLIEADDESFLAWARRPWACIVMNLHVDHDRAGLERAVRGFRVLIDLARARGGSYFLTYHRWATREQLLGCYPQFPQFLARKRHYDPDERFQSEWYRHYRALLA